MRKYIFSSNKKTINRKLLKYFDEEDCNTNENPKPRSHKRPINFNFNINQFNSENFNNNNILLNNKPNILHVESANIILDNNTNLNTHQNEEINTDSRFNSGSIGKKHHKRNGLLFINDEDKSPRVLPNPFKDVKLEFENKNLSTNNFNNNNDFSRNNNNNNLNLNFKNSNLIPGYNDDVFNQIKLGSSIYKLNFNDNLNNNIPLFNFNNNIQENNNNISNNNTNNMNNNKENPNLNYNINRNNMYSKNIYNRLPEFDYTNPNYRYNAFNYFYENNNLNNNKSEHNINPLFPPVNNLACSFGDNYERNNPRINMMYNQTNYMDHYLNPQISSKSIQLNKSIGNINNLNQINHGINYNGMNNYVDLNSPENNNRLNNSFNSLDDEISVNRNNKNKRQRKNNRNNNKGSNKNINVNNENQNVEDQCDNMENHMYDILNPGLFKRLRYNAENSTARLRLTDIEKELSAYIDNRKKKRKNKDKKKKNGNFNEEDDDYSNNENNDNSISRKQRPKFTRHTSAFFLTYIDNYLNKEACEYYKDYFSKIKDFHYYICCRDNNPENNGDVKFFFYVQFDAGYEFNINHLITENITYLNMSGTKIKEIMEKHGFKIDEGGRPKRKGGPSINDLTQMEISERGNESAYLLPTIEKLNKRDTNMYIGTNPIKAVRVFICHGKEIFELNEMILTFLASLYRPYDNIYFSGNFWFGTSKESTQIACMLNFRSKNLYRNEFQRLIDKISFNLNIKSGDFKNNYIRIFIATEEGPDELYVNPDNPNAPRPNFGEHVQFIDMALLDDNEDLYQLFDVYPDQNARNTIINRNNNQIINNLNNNNRFNIINEDDSEEDN